MAANTLSDCACIDDKKLLKSDVETAWNLLAHKITGNMQRKTWRKMV
jgi:hypothetical protein